MAKYNKDEIFKMAKDAIVENNLFFISDIIGFLPLNNSTFYEYFPVDSERLNELKEMLNKNKIKTKANIRAKLYRSPKAGELLALYRLVCTPEERKYLNQQYIENTVKSEQPIVLDIKLEGVEIKKNENNDGDGDNNENIENNEG